MRLVPTLMTIRIVCAGCGVRVRLRELCQLNCGARRQEGQHLYPAVRMTFLARRKRLPIDFYACFECYQPFFRSSRKLYPVSTELSARSSEIPEQRLRAHAKPRGCGHCLRHGHLDADPVGAWQSRVCG